MLRRAKSVLDLELFDEKYIKQHVCYPTWERKKEGYYQGGFWKDTKEIGNWLVQIFMLQMDCSDDF